MRYLFTLLFVAATCYTHAGIEQYSERIEGSALTVSTALEVYDIRYFEMDTDPSWPSSFTNYKVQNKVRLGYMYDNYPTSDETTTVTVEIERWKYVSGAFTIVAESRELIIDFKQNGVLAMDELTSFIAEDGHRMRVTIVNIDGPVDHIFLESVVEVERYYDMNTASITDYGYNPINYIVGTDGLEPELNGTTSLYDPRIEFWWDEVLGAEEYELEWTFVSNYDFDIPTGLLGEDAATVLEFNFYDNSTRVQLSENHYEIPGMFNRGYVVYRVRAIGRQGTNFEYRSEGDWSFAETGTISTFAATAVGGVIQLGEDFEADKNWAHNVSYTENGKRFEGASYADGLGRTRQSLGRNTATDQVVINNAYFDKAGRPVIGDLATPSEEENFSYRKFFNGLMVSGVEQDFTLANYLLEADNCVLPNPMAQTRGAGQYYSSQNLNQDGANANIPDAFGYPFSKAVYVDDPTGRMREVGGYGLEHQTTQHSTRMFYDTPTQDELNRLFGTDVGLKEHYQKTITIDANGQAYVQYTDLAGRVIATALAGDTPSALVALSNNLGNVLETNEVYNAGLDNNSDPTIASYAYNKVILTDDSPLTLVHDFDPAIFEDPTCIEGICFDCHYDFEIKMERIDCPTAEPIYEYSEMMSGEAINHACDLTNFALPSTHLITGLDIGEYVITKTLKISDGVAELYWCEYIENSTCGPFYDVIYNDLYNATDFGCDAFTGTLPAAPSYCDFKRQQLISDMAVGGQYGEVSDGAGGIDVSLHPVSVYNDNGYFPINSWQNISGQYLNDDGNVAVIYLTDLGGGTYSPTPAVGVTVQFDPTNNEPFIYPNELANIADFIFYSETAWGEELIELHPEYCYLQFCEQYGSDFHAYSEELDGITTFDEACAGGYFAPLGNTTLTIPAYSGCVTTPPIEDAFFTTTGYFGPSNLNGVYQWAEDYYPCVPVMSYSSTSDIINFYNADETDSGPAYLTLWQYAIWQVTCPDLTDHTAIVACVNAAVLDDCNKDLVWQIFKSEYEALREQSYLFAQSAYVAYPSNLTGGGCGYSYNHCIGEGNYGAYTRAACFDVFYHEDVTPTSLTSSLSVPCSSPDAVLFAAKVPRFGNFYDAELTLPTLAEDDIELYVATQLATVCQESCESQADGWMATLSDCVSAGTQEYIDIRAGFIAVCAGGCDESNMIGASDLAAISGSVDITVNGVITAVSSFESVLLAVLGAGYETTSCSHYLISSPAPYGANFNQSLQTTVDECACDAVLKAKDDFNTGPSPGVTSIVDQLAFNTGISYTAAASLACMCAQEYEDSHGDAWTPADIGTWNATSLTNLAGSGITVPNSLTCNVAPCQDCADMNTLYSTFETRFGTGIEDDPSFDLLLQNFMNFTLSFNMSADQYVTFMEVCNSSSGAPVCAITTVAPVFVDLIDVIARRGQLTSTTAIDLTDNIVYENSAIGSLFTGTDYTGTVLVDDLTMLIGDATVVLTIPSGADFTFDDILTISNIEPLPCDTDEFELTVQVLECGIVEERTILGNTSDFDLITCYCGGTIQDLCNVSSPYFASDNCYKPELVALNSTSMDFYVSELALAHDVFIDAYITQCATAFDTETIDETSNNNIYQFTLFYYDQAGNLAKTVAPEGVDLAFKISGATYPDVDADRGTGTIVNVPNHDFITAYEYNSYNQLVSTTNPDQEGNTVFWYDGYGRIIASQNPVQADILQYSYSLYDVQGRPVEVGQLNRLRKNGTTMSVFTEADIKQDDLGVWFKNWVYDGTRTEVTITTYDKYEDPLTPAKFKQTPNEDNMRLRVATVRYYASIPDPVDYDLDYESAIYYAYDVHGNVVEQIQDVPMLAPVEQDLKSTQYEFELISGNVSKINYQEDELDFFAHEYYYDELNRLTEVFASSDNVHNTREAHYHYYDYGPMARTELGQHKVQGQDYAYTINGWLKGLNASTLSVSKDMGDDGGTGYLAANTNVHSLVARDVNAYTIGYFDGDYTSISSGDMEMTSVPTDDFATDANDLYNGNIRHLVTSIEGMTTMGTSYHYDQLQRLTDMTANYNTNTDNTWTGMSSTLEYYNAYSYDKNGNIKNLQRNGTVVDGLLMDNFAYNYTTVGGQLSNRLDYVAETGADDNPASLTGDIHPMLANNFAYDKIGQLLSDVSEGISDIDWRYGDKKMKKMKRNDASSPEVEFVYNPFGIRVLKIEKTRTAGVLNASEEWRYTYYAHDANGQCMAVYDVNLSTTNNQARIDEHHIYGASRLGMLKEGELIYDNGNTLPAQDDVVEMTVGLTRYELSNHLGNVQAVITDRKLYNPTDVLYEAVVMMTSDYYPFGMQMPDRHTEVESYRYAYNGMEQDNEVSGNGNSYTTEFRQYDPRLGRWKSLDPLMSSFPHMSPYVAFDNNPIFYVDPYGLSSSVKGEPDEVITRTGSWKKDKTKRDELLKEMDVADGTIVQFVYPDDARQSEGTYTLNGNKWEGTYTYNTSLDSEASWNIRASGSDAVFLDGEIPPNIAKTIPPVPVDNTQDQSGQTGTPPGGGDDGGNPPRGGGGGNPPRGGGGGGPPPPPCIPINLNTGFSFWAVSSGISFTPRRLINGRTPSQNFARGSTPVSWAVARTRLDAIFNAWNSCANFTSIRLTINTSAPSSTRNTRAWGLNNRTSFNLQASRATFIRGALQGRGIPASAFSPGWWRVVWDLPVTGRINNQILIR